MKIKKFDGKYFAENLDLLRFPAREEKGIEESICLVSRSGCLSFQYNMTKAQAIEIAAALVEFSTMDDEEAAQ